MKVGMSKFSKEKLGVRVAKAEGSFLGHRVYQLMVIDLYEVWLHSVPLSCMRCLYSHLLNSTSFLTPAQKEFLFLTTK